MTVRRELARVKAEQNRTDLSEGERREQYGAMQALSWVLGRDAAAPHTLTHTRK